MTTICICGGGSLGHVVGGFLSAKHKMVVNILTNRPEQWQHNIVIQTPENEQLIANIGTISKYPQDVVATADIVLLCVPGFLIRKTLEQIKPYLQEETFVGSVFSSTGFFFEAFQILEATQPLWGFQRVPFIARTNIYGQSAFLLGYKSSFNIAVENVCAKEKQAFCNTIAHSFERPTHLLSNYLEASISNSNPLMHPARLYSLFHNWHKGISYSEQIPFYTAWTTEASELLIKMDNELFDILKVLPFKSDHLVPILDYYESSDALSLTRKIASIPSFQSILSPMKHIENGWIPDFSHRYFAEDFAFGLRFIRDLAHRHNIATPTIDEIFDWGIKNIDPFQNYEKQQL